MSNVNLATLFYIHAVYFMKLQVLWPYLLEFLVPVQYTGATGIVSRCVADIGKRKREEEADDYELNFDELCEHACVATVYFALL